MMSRFPPFAFVELVSPYNKKNITRWLEDMNFMFSWQEQYLTRSLRSLVRYCSCHSNIKFISSRHRVISSIYEQFASNISRTRISGSFRVLCKPRLIFSRINGPNVYLLIECLSFSLSFFLRKKKNRCTLQQVMLYQEIFSLRHSSSS